MPSSAALRIETASAKATVLAIVGTVAALAVGLGIFGANVEGILIAATTDGIVLVGLVSNAIHTGEIEPSAITAAVIALVVQVLALFVAFAWITNATASHVLAITTAVALAIAQIAHALLSRQVASDTPLRPQLGEVKWQPVTIDDASIKALGAEIVAKAKPAKGGK